MHLPAAMPGLTISCGRTEMQSNIPDKLQALLQRELKPDERIVWQARPAPLSRVLPALPVSAFGIVLLMFAIFWTSAVTRRGNVSQTDGLGPVWFGYLFGGVPVIFALGAVLSPLWTFWVGRNTVYAVTDRRALLIEAPYKHSVRSFAGDRLLDFVRNERADGRGDLVFHQIGTRVGRSRTLYRDVGFLGIDNVKEVDELLRRAYAATDGDPATRLRMVE